MTDIAAGIVLYNPDFDKLSNNIYHILPQVSLLILVDNGSTDFEYVYKKYVNDEKIHIIRNEQNLGISKALNQIMHYSLENNISWTLTLDQDSVCSENLIKTYLPYIELDQIAIISPTIIDINTKSQLEGNGDLVDEEKNKEKFSYITRCITSGSLTNTAIWKLLNGFDENMFIDYVDFEYCSNVITHGYKIIKVYSALMYHELGHASKVRIFNKNCYTYNHSPQRSYYYARNVIYYIRKYSKSAGVKKEIYLLVKWAFLKILFEKQKIKKCNAIRKGIIDGIRLKIN